jgi:hypothetical protein
MTWKSLRVSLPWSASNMAATLLRHATCRTVSPRLSGPCACPNWRAMAVTCGFSISDDRLLAV